MSSLFLLTNISMPNNDRTGGTFLLNSTQKRCQHWYYLQPKTKKIILFSFWRRLLTYSTILLQWIRSIFKIVCDCVWLYTYLLKSTYLLFGFFSLFLCFLSFCFLFFCKKPNPDYFFCKKILRTFLPPPNNVMLCFSYFQKHLNQEKKVNKSKKTKHQISSQINNF